VEKEPDAIGDQQVDEQTVPEPSNVGRRRWLRHRLGKRLQRQRSAPGASSHAAPSASVDDSVSSHIQMLNSLDSQVSRSSLVSSKIAPARIIQLRTVVDTCLCEIKR